MDTMDAATHMDWQQWLSIAAMVVSFIAFGLSRSDRSRQTLLDADDKIGGRLDKIESRLLKVELADATTHAQVHRVSAVDSAQARTRDELHSFVADMNGTLSEIRSELRHANERMARIEQALERAVRAGGAEG